VVVDYWLIAGCHICPEDEREQSLGQLLEAAFYMGASFFGGQVGDTLALDGAYVDELTRETFAVLTENAVAAMETAGETMALNGRAYADRDEPETD